MHGTVERCQQLKSLVAQDRVNSLWSKLGQRLKDKAALVKAGVRNRQGWVVEDAVIVQQDVEIDGAWAPALCGRFAPALTLNGLKLDEQRVRLERGVDFDNRIQVRTLRRSDRFRLDDARHLDEAYAVRRP